MRKFFIEVISGRITDQNVDLIVNSSNSYLLLGSGTSEQVRETGGYLSPDDNDYWDLVNRTEPTLKKVLDYIHSKRPIPSKVQKECLNAIIEKNYSKELKLGNSVLTSSGDLAKVKDKAKYVAHAVGMTYDWKVQPNPPIIPATFKSVKNSLKKSFEIADNLNCESIAIPVMCTRKGGLTREESSEATSQALENLRYKDSTVRKAVLVLYSDELKEDKEWFNRFYRLFNS